MSFLANENVPLVSVHRLREAGHDVTAVAVEAPGSSDQAVLARAVAEGRVVLTFDRDYGELIYRRKLPTPAGVVYFRYAPCTPQEPAEHLLAILGNRAISLTGRFTVAERGQIRQRPLP